MKKLRLVMTAFAVLMLVSCNGRGARQVDNTATDTVATVSDKEITGQWYIRSVVINDSLYAYPSKIAPDIRQYVIFDENGTIDVKTNCNGMSGYYALKGDSLDINGLSWTELSCDNMTVEEMLRQLLPKVCVCKIENDSILLLYTAISGERIVLRKATERK